MSLLERVEKLSNVDVDDVSTDVIKSLPFTPHNQTSNQAAVTGELLKPAYCDFLKQMVTKYGSEGWERVYDMAGVHLCARNVPHLSGRTLLQTSLRYANDKDAIIKQCRSYAKAFEDLGVSRDRFCIKIPFTGAGACASQVLNAEGIRTLATTVFSLEQGIAASQAGCLFISPYFNEIAAHLDASVRPDYKDPALESPMSARVVHILDAYAKAYRETGKEQPIMVAASFFTNAEILAMAEMGCQHITISAAVLKSLQDTPDTLPPVTTQKPSHAYATLVTPERLRELTGKDELAGKDWDGVFATMETDFLADGGKKLDDFIQNDPIVSHRFGDANQFFQGMEATAQGAIEKEMEAQGIASKS